MKKVDKFHRHEVLDRCMMLCSVLDSEILGHPALTSEMTTKIKEALSLVYSVGCTAGDTPCKKCGRTALVPKGKKKMVCLYCFHKQKRKKHV